MKQKWAKYKEKFKKLAIQKKKLKKVKNYYRNEEKLQGTQKRIEFKWNWAMTVHHICYKPHLSTSDIMFHLISGNSLTTTSQ